MGENGSGQLGQNNETNYSSPVQIPGTTWNIVHAGDEYSCAAIKTDGTLWVWGYNNKGQLGDNSTARRSSPTQIPGTTWSNINNGSPRHSRAAIKTDGTLWRWGGNTSGELGQNNLTHYSSPVQIPGTTWNEIGTTGYNDFMATKTDGTLWSWGLNEEGVGGESSMPHDYSSPIQIGSHSMWTSDQIGGRSNASFVMLEDTSV